MSIDLYPKLLTMVTAAEGVIGPYPSVTYRVSNILYLSDFDIEPFSPLPPKDITQEYKNKKIVTSLGDLAGYLKYNPRPDQNHIVEELKNIGKWISENILPKHCLSCCQNGLPQCIEIVTNQQEIPWELAWVQNDFLAKQVVHARRPFVARSRHRAPIHNRIPRMAIIVGRTGGLFSAHYELNEIRHSYETIFGKTVEIFEGEVVNIDLLRHVLLGSDFLGEPFDIIHFIGHGNSSNNHVWLELMGSPFLIDDVPAVIGGNPLVFWNSCFGASVSSPEYRYQSDIVDAFGSRLLSNGAGHFIGPLFPAIDSEAKRFSVTFYKYLFTGISIGRAFYNAKVDLCNLNPIIHTYVLYGNPTMRMVYND